MISPDDVIAEARRWIGTPEHHQWATLGRGCDCAGLVRGVAENLGLAEISDEQRRALSSYPRTPDPARMGALLSEFLTPTEHAGEGCVVWIAWLKGLPQHLGILASFDGRPTIIHSIRVRGVVEHGFTASWKRRANSYWRFPNVAYPDG